MVLKVVVDWIGWLPDQTRPVALLEIPSSDRLITWMNWCDKLTGEFPDQYMYSEKFTIGSQNDYVLVCMNM